MGELIKVNLEPASIRVMRKKPTGGLQNHEFYKIYALKKAQREYCVPRKMFGKDFKRLS